MDERPELPAEFVFDESNLGTHPSAAHHESQEFHAVGRGDPDPIGNEAGADAIPRVPRDDDHLGLEAVDLHANGSGKLDDFAEEGLQQGSRDFLQGGVGREVADSKVLVHSLHEGSVVDVFEE